jgi:PAS domain S-box-containing protein
MPPDSLLLKTMAELARLAFIVESSDDAIISEDLDGTILTWNRGAAAIYGYSAEEAIGRSTNLLVPPDRAAEEEAILARIRAGLRTQHFETVRIKKNGIPIDVSLTISPILDEENRVVAISRSACVWR